MTATCQRCAQPEADASTSNSRRTHWVTDDVLACFNQAHEDAERRGMPEVGIAHLVLSLAADQDAAAMLVRSGVDPTVVTVMIEATLPPRRTSGSHTLPRSAQDLTALLDIAQRSARIAGQTHITTEILLATLLSLPSALMGVHELSRWIWAARTYPGPRDVSTTMREPRQPLDAASDAAPKVDFGWLEARLDRHEQLLIELQSRIRITLDEVWARAPSPAYRSPPQQTVLPPEEAARLSTSPQSPAKADPATEELPDDDELDDEEAQATGIKRYYLSMDDEIVRAPSIGPATAARLQPHGITHVKHLLAVDPERLSARLGARHLTASRIAAWKNQARLVCSIPWLRGTHAQLLVGAGYASIERILSADRPVVCAAIMQFATTRDGQSILRNGHPPEMDRIMRWIENSQHAEPQRAEPTRVMGARVVN